MRTAIAPLLLLTILSATGCSPKAGPTPLLEQARASRADEQGRATVWARMRVDFKDAKPGATKSALWEKALEEVTFELERGGERDRVRPALVPITVETARTGDSSWPDRFAADVVFFPEGVAGRSYRVHATNYYQPPDADPVYLDFSGGGGEAPPVRIPPVTRVTLQRGVSDGKDRIEVVLGGDAPANLALWHHLDGQVKRMKRRGGRVYYRIHRPKPADNHRVILQYGKEWVSPPYPVTPTVSDEDLDTDEG